MEGPTRPKPTITWQGPEVAVVAVVAVGLVLLGAAIGAGLFGLGVSVGARLTSSRNGSPPPLAGSPSPPPVASTSPSASSTQFAVPPLSGCVAPACAIGNFDGTGQKETFTASPVTDGSGKTVDWLLQINGPAGTTHSGKLSSLVAARGGCPALTDIQYATVVGAADFGGPSQDLAMVEVSHGASTRFAVLVGASGDGLGLVTVGNGAERCQRVFPFSGSVTHGNGLACGWRDTTLVLYVRQATRTPSDSTLYDWYEAIYTWQGLNLSLQSVGHAVITSADDRLQPAYRVVCGSINLP